MPDDLTKRRPQDALRINENEPYEVNWWCDELNCTEEELKAAVKAVGVMAVDVKKHLGK
jgi:hypothetical protein